MTRVIMVSVLRYPENLAELLKKRNFELNYNHSLSKEKNKIRLNQKLKLNQRGVTHNNQFDVAYEILTGYLPYLRFPNRCTKKAYKTRHPEIDCILEPDKSLVKDITQTRGKFEIHNIIYFEGHLNPDRYRDHRNTAHFFFEEASYPEDLGYILREIKAPGSVIKDLQDALDSYGKEIII